MKVSVIAHPNSKHPQIKKTEEGTYHVYVSQSPHEGKANQAVIEALASYLDIPKTHIELIRGGTGKKKIFLITT